MASICKYLPADYAQEYILMSEYNLLQSYHTPGVFMMPSKSSHLEWFGIVFIRHGSYQGGIFAFNLHLPQDFPSGSIPVVIFQPIPFHPLIDPGTGHLYLGDCFPKSWQPQNNHIWQVLHYIRRIFIKPEQSDQPLNTAAMDLLMSDGDKFHEQCQNSAFESKNEILSSNKLNPFDYHGLNFTGWDDEDQLDEMRRQLVADPWCSHLVKSGSKNGRQLGFSWLNKETLSVFATEEGAEEEIEEVGNDSSSNN